MEAQCKLTSNQKQCDNPELSLTNKNNNANKNNNNASNNNGNWRHLKFFGLSTGQCRKLWKHSYIFARLDVGRAGSVSAGAGDAAPVDVVVPLCVKLATLCVSCAHQITYSADSLSYWRVRQAKQIND